MARPKSSPSRNDLERLSLTDLRELLKTTIEIEKKKTKAEKDKAQADAKRMRFLLGDAVIASFEQNDLTTIIKRVIPSSVTAPDDLGLFAQWLEPSNTDDSGAPQSGAH